MVGKFHKQILQVPRAQASRRLEMVHADICGPTKDKGFIGDYRYFCVFVDGYSRFTCVFCLKTKDNIRTPFKEFKAIQENFTELRILFLFSNNKGALLEKNFQF